MQPDLKHLFSWLAFFFFFFLFGPRCLDEIPWLRLPVTKNPMSSIESAKTLADQRPINTFHLEMARGYVKDISIVAKQKKKLSRPPYPPNCQRKFTTW